MKTDLASGAPAYRGYDRPAAYRCRQIRVLVCREDESLVERASYYWLGWGVCGANKVGGGQMELGKMM